MFAMVKNITFSAVDKQLIEAKNELSGANVKLEILYRIFNLKSLGIFEDNLDHYNMNRNLKNPQIIMVLRDYQGNIINENDLGKIKDYLKDVTFDKEYLEKIYKLKLNDEYNYRCLNFILSSSDDSVNEYAQLLINVDSEIGLNNNYLKIISYAVIFGILLSTIASLVLSKKTLKPINETLKRQTEFVQNAAHELRTPLTIIQAKQELLLQEPNAKIIDKSEEIILTLEETKRLSKLTKDLMILVRGANTKSMDLQKQDIEIDELIKSIVLPYMDIANSQEKQIILDLKYKKEICVDTNQIHQLLIILLDNAIKYTEKNDQIKIKTYLKDNKCVIEVCDTGIGISDDALNRVFDRFYREDKARSRETGGSGLGLSIASMIVASHNGSIKASHNTPKGTIFTVKFNRYEK